MDVVYETAKGYFYEIKQKSKKVKTVRIPKKKYKKKQKEDDKNKIKVGDMVKIIVKPYNKKKMVTGKIKKILTKKKNHTRGRKVRLEDGTIGRMVKKLNKNKDR